MNKIIGGLLVVSLLSHPSVSNINYRAYDIFNKENKIVFVVKREDSKEEKESGKGAADIDRLMASVEDNTRKVTGLLKEKSKVLGKIETAMDLRTYAKASLDENQMNSFSGFVKYCAGENTAVQEALSKVDSKKDLNNVKKEMLHNATDYGYVYNELATINSYQNDAISSLTGIINEGNNVLSILYA